MATPGPNELTLGDVMNAGARVLRHDWTPETKDFVRSQGRKFLRDLRKYKHALPAGSRAQVRGREFLLEHSFSGKFCALLLAHPKVRKTPTGPGAKPLTLPEAIVRAEQVKTRNWSGESVRVTVKEKPEGGTRHTCAFGPRWRAANYLADCFLALRWGDNPLEYSRMGRGRDAAIRDALLAYKNGGVRRFIQADVKNCYGSIAREKLLSEVPLPAAFAMFCLAIPDEAPIAIENPTPHPSPMDLAVRAVIPQGLRTSARIVSHILRSALAGLDVPFKIVHGDDILVGLKAGAKLKAVKGALVSALAGHPAGPLLLKQCATYRLEGGHDYTGYEFVQRSHKYGGYAKARPSRKAIRRFQLRTAEKIALLPSENQEDEAARICDAWARSFGVWDGRKNGAGIALQDFALDVLPTTLKFRVWLSDNGPLHLEAALKVFRDDWLPHLRKKLLPQS